MVGFLSRRRGRGSPARSAAALVAAGLVVSGRSGLRVESTAKAGEGPPRPRLEALIGLASSASEDRARGAARAGALHDPLFVGPLSGLLTDPDPFVRSAAARALGELGVPDRSRDFFAMIRALVRAMEDRDDGVAESAALALGRYPFPEARLRLERVARNREAPPRRRAAAGRALTATLGEEARARMDAWLDLSVREASSPLEPGVERARPPSEDLSEHARDLLDPDLSLHLAAARSIAAWPVEEERAPFLGRALREDDVEVRRVAARALSAGRTVLSGLALAPGCDDADRDVRAACVEGLGRFEDEAIARALIERIRVERDAELRDGAKRAIARQADAHVFAFLSEWDHRSRDDALRDAIDIVSARTSTAASRLLVRFLVESRLEDVARRASQHLERRRDEEAVPPLLAALESSEPESRTRGRVIPELLRRRDPRISERALAILSRGGGDEALLRLVRERHEARSGLLALAESEDGAIRSLVLRGIQTFRGEDVIRTVASVLSKHPGEDEAFRILLAQDREAIVEPLLDLLASPAQGARCEAILLFLRGERDPRIAGPVTRAALARPEIASSAIVLLSGQEASQAIPRLAEIAAEKRLGEGPRADALRAIARFQADEVLPWVRPHALDPSVQVRMAARNALHELAPDVYPKWDPYGRVPLVSESALFGASMLLILSDIADARLSPAFTAAVGAVLGGATPFLLTLNEDVTLGDAAYFGTIGLWGTLGGWGVGGVLRESEDTTKWLTVAGEVLGLSVGSLTMKDAEWSLDDALLAHVSLVEAGMTASAMTSLFLRGGDDADPSVAYAGLVGGALAAVPLAILGRRLEVDGHLPLIGLSMAHGAWLGLFLPGATGDGRLSSDEAFAALVAGQGVGYFAGLALAQVGGARPATLGLTSLGTLAGAATLGGLGLFVEPWQGRTSFLLSEAGSVIGAISLGLLAEALEFRHNDEAIVALSGIAGALGGGMFPVRLEEKTFDELSFPGGVLFGAGLGTIAGLTLSQLVDATDRALNRTVLGGVVLGAGGMGFGLVVPDLGVRPRSLITGASALAGVALTAPFSDDLDLGDEALGALMLGSAAGGLFGGFLPSYAHASDESIPGREVAGGVLFGSQLGLAAAVAASQSLSLDTEDVAFAAHGTAAGSAIGGGLGLLVPAFDRRVSAALVQGVGLSALIGMTSLVSSNTIFGRVEHSVALHATLFGIAGAWQGGLIPSVWREGRAPESEVFGGALFGAGLGSLAGVLLSGFGSVDLDAPDLFESSLMVGAANGFGGGIGLLARDRRLGAALMEGLGVAGLVGATIFAPDTSYGSEAGTTLLLGMGTFGWMGGWLPYVFSERDPESGQVAGGVLAGASLGVLSSALYNELVEEREDLETLMFTTSGLGMGAGLGLLVPRIGRRGTVTLMESSGAVLLSSGLLLSPATTYDEGDRSLLFLGASLGAWHGAWIPGAWRAEPVPKEEVVGGLLFGSSLGLLGAMAAAQGLEIEGSDVVEIALLTSLSSLTGAGLSLALPSGSRRRDALTLEGLGLLGIAGALFVSPHTTYEGEDYGLISLFSAAGLWHGIHFPRLFRASPTAGQRVGGASLGFGAGALSAVLLSQVGPAISYSDEIETLLFSVAGDALGGGLGLLAFDASATASAVLLDVAGVSLLGLGYALSPETRYTGEDRALVTIGALLGAWHGGWLPSAAFDSDAVLEGRRVAGGALFGAGLGALTGGVLSQTVSLDASQEVEGVFGWMLASSVGAGLGLLMEGEGRRSRAALIEGSGILGLTLGLALSERTRYARGDFALLPLGAALGAGVGLTIPAFVENEGRRTGEVELGGALLGAGALGLGSAIFAQVTDFDLEDVGEIGGGTVVGGALGLGLGKMLPGSGRALELGLMNATGLASLAVAAAWAPDMSFSGDDAITLALLGSLGATLGGFSPGLWNGASLGTAPAEQVGGGVLFGTGLGIAAGMFSSELIEPTGEDRAHLAFGAVSGGLAGAGVGLLSSEDDRIAIGLLEGLTLAGAVGVASTASALEYDAGDLAFGSLYVGYLTWHSLGLTLLLEGTDRQAAGAAMTTVGLGALTGMYLAPYIHLDTAEVLMLFAGNVWGTWIGGWGGAILRDHVGRIEGRRSTGLTLLSAVLGSDVGLTLSGLVVGGLLDVPPTRFAVINLAGLGGMMVGMLAAGFAKDEPLKAGNVFGSLGGLLLGSLVTSFIDFEEGPTWEDLLETSPKRSELESKGSRKDAAEASASNRSVSAFGIETWFPSADLEQGAEGEERYLFSVKGTWW